jgi:hypothetical protein
MASFEKSGMLQAWPSHIHVYTIHSYKVKITDIDRCTNERKSVGVYQDMLAGRLGAHVLDLIAPVSHAATSPWPLNQRNTASIWISRHSRSQMAPNGGNTITFTEVDELDNPASTLIYSELQSGQSVKDGLRNEIRGRVDIAVSTFAPYIRSRTNANQHVPGASTPWSMKSIQNLLADVFLPAGYPHSVSEDYVP